MDGLKPLEFPVVSRTDSSTPGSLLTLQYPTGYPTAAIAQKYPTDLDDVQWELVAQLIPPGKPVGIARTTPMRAVVNAILYRTRCRCSWRMLPRDFPHWRTVYGYQRQWQLDGTWQRIRDAMRQHAKRQADSAARTVLEPQAFPHNLRENSQT